MELVGRDAAIGQVDAWVSGLAHGAAGLLISGEAGIGKTAIWEVAVGAARRLGLDVLQARPVEAELPLGYASLADLLGDRLPSIAGALGDDQVALLELATGTGTGAAGHADPLAVGRATLRALQLLAESSPVVLAIDDLQWLDPASARVLGYALRRIGPARIGLVATLRSGHVDPLDAAGIFGSSGQGPFVRLELAGLPIGALEQLLRSRAHPELPRRHLARIRAQSRGNPYYALQLARAGGDLPESLAAGLGRHLDTVPAGAVAVIERIAVLGPQRADSFADATAVDGAIEAGVLIESDGITRFEHPLLAEAAYRRIPPGRRRALHRAAARQAEGAERARHLALATTTPDAGVAEFLAAAAREERRRGAPDAAADLAAAARRLVPAGDPDTASRIAMDQADYLFLAADEVAAAALVDEVLAGPARGTSRVRALVHRALAQVEAGPAVALLEAAASEPHDDAILRARTLAQLAWQRGAWLGEVDPALAEAESAVELAEATGNQSVIATALTTLGLLLSYSRGAAEQAFQRAVDILARTPNEAGDHTPHLAFAHERWWRGHFAAAEQLLEAERRRAVDAGDDGVLMRVRVLGADLLIRQGRWAAAEAELKEALIDARGYWRLVAVGRLGILLARRGSATATALAEELESTDSAFDPIFGAQAAFIRGLLAAADGRATDAADSIVALPRLAAAHRARAPENAALLPDAIAVLAAAGRVDVARELASTLGRLLPLLAPWGQAAVDYATGVIALAEGDAAEDRLRAAASGFEALGAPWELGQALLALGRTQRRAGRRSEAAATLDRAAAIFASLDARPAADAAARELRLARPRPRSDDRLTEAEIRVAELAAAGRTNREIAAALFTGLTTVEAHLTRIYSKLAIRSRTELARRVSEGSLNLREVTPD